VGLYLKLTTSDDAVQTSRGLPSVASTVQAAPTAVPDSPRETVFSLNRVKSTFKRLLRTSTRSSSIKKGPQPAVPVPQVQVSPPPPSTSIDDEPLERIFQKPTTIPAISYDFVDPTTLTASPDTRAALVDLPSTPSWFATRLEVTPSFRSNISSVLGQLPLEAEQQIQKHPKPLLAVPTRIAFVPSSTPPLSPLEVLAEESNDPIQEVTLPEAPTLASRASSIWSKAESFATANSSLVSSA